MLSTHEKAVLVGTASTVLALGIYYEQFAAPRTRKRINHIVGKIISPLATLVAMILTCLLLATIGIFGVPSLIAYELFKRARAYCIRNHATATRLLHESLSRASDALFNVCWCISQAIRAMNRLVCMLTYGCYRAIYTGITAFAKWIASTLASLIAIHRERNARLKEKHAAEMASLNQRLDACITEQQRMTNEFNSLKNTLGRIEAECICTFGICLLQNPVELKCRHIVSNEPWQIWKAKNWPQPPCPVCREISESEYALAPALRNIIGILSEKEAN